MGTAFSIQKFLIVCCQTGPAQLGIGMSIDMIMYYVFIHLCGMSLFLQSICETFYHTNSTLGFNE